MGRLRRPTRALGIAAAWVVVGLHGTARAGDDEELQAAIATIEGAQYADAAKRLERMLDPKESPCAAGPELSPGGCRVVNPELVKRSREQYVVALYALGRVEDARLQIEAILDMDPTFQANPTLFPQRLMNLFVEVRGRRAERIAEAAKSAAEKAHREKAERDAERRAELAYIDALEAQAAQERAVESRSRLVALVPFGVGQLQNEDLGLAVFFGSSQLIAGGASIVFAFLHEDFEAESQRTDVDEAEAESQADGLRAANHVAFGLFAASVVAGVVEAQLSFDEEVVTVRKRPLPARPRPAAGASIVPTVVPVGGGAALGARGAF